MSEKKDQVGPSGIKEHKNLKESITNDTILKFLTESDPSDVESFVIESSDESEDSENSLRKFRRPNVKTDEEYIPEVPTNLIWTDNFSDMKNFSFIKQEQLLIPIPGDNPIDYFMHIFSDDFMQLIVSQTNEFAVKLFLMTTSEHARITTWKDITKDELMKFIGLLLHMGHIKMNRIQDYWKKDSLHKINVFPAVMSRNRFLLILRVLHFANNAETPSEDMLYKIRPILNHFNERMCSIIYPGCQLSIDESMFFMRGCLQFGQYVANKKHKLCMLTDTKGLVLKLAIYTGSVNDAKRYEHTEDIVMELLLEKLNVGHSIYMNRFYNSYNLAQQLLASKTYCTGPLTPSRKNYPIQLTMIKLTKGETIGKYANGVLIGKWKDNKEISYISTEFKNAMIEVSSKRSDVKNKPTPIVEYNKYMSSINRQDQILSYYNCERKTLRWSLKIFVYILQVMINNAHKIFNKYSGRRMALYDFRIEVVKKLLQLPSGCISAPADVQPKKQSTFEHILSHRNVRGADGKIKRKQCKSCYDSSKKRKDTIYTCKTCPNEPGYCLDCAKITHT